MVVNILAVITNIGLNLVLIPKYSYLGAAAATAVSYVLLNILYSYALFHETGIQPFTTHLLRPGAAATVAMIVIFGTVATVFPRTIWAALLSIVVFVLVYGIVILRFGAIQEEEVMLLQSIEERFGLNLQLVKSIANRFVG